jgi:hypothetical protein
MKWLIASVAAATIIFFLLQSHDDAKADRARAPRASNGKRVATFFFLVLLCVIVGYFISSSGTAGEGVVSGGSMPRPSRAAPPAQLDKNLLEAHMIKSIREDVLVGGAPF